MTTSAVIPTPQWRGVNHLALVTSDMDATVRFYHGVLGARLVGTVANDEFRHYFFDFGSHCTVAFFEYAGSCIEPFTKLAGVPDPRAAQFDHVALNLPDEEALIQLRWRLKYADCEVTDVIDHGSVRSVYFTDPNGIALEASWWVNDPTGRPVDYGDHGQFGDPDPVAAVRELEATGAVAASSARLAWLVDGGVLRRLACQPNMIGWARSSDRVARTAQTCTRVVAQLQADQLGRPQIGQTFGQTNHDTRPGQRSFGVRYIRRHLSRGDP